MTLNKLFNLKSKTCKINLDYWQFAKSMCVHENPKKNRWLSHHQIFLVYDLHTYPNEFNPKTAITRYFH